MRFCALSFSPSISFLVACVYLMRKRRLNSIKRRKRKHVSHPTSFKYFFKLFSLAFFSLGIFFSYPLLLQQKCTSWKENKTLNKNTTSNSFFPFHFYRALWMCLGLALLRCSLFSSYVHFNVFFFPFLWEFIEPKSVHRISFFQLSVVWLWKCITSREVTSN